MFFVLISVSSLCGTETHTVREKENININFFTFFLSMVCWFNVHLVCFYNLMLGFTIIDWNKKKKKKEKAYKAQLSQRWTKRHGKMNCKSKWEICERDSAAVTRRATFLRIGQPKNKSHSIHSRGENFRGSFVHITYTREKEFLPFATRSFSHASDNFFWLCMLCVVTVREWRWVKLVLLHLVPYVWCAHTNIKVYWLFM